MSDLPTVTIATERRPEGVKVPAFHVDRGLAAVKLGEGLYSVTHVRSGLAIGFFDREGATREAIRRLAPLTNWDRPPSRLLRSKRLTREVNTVLRDLAILRDMQRHEEHAIKGA